MPFFLFYKLIEYVPAWIPEVYRHVYPAANVMGTEICQCLAVPQNRDHVWVRNEKHLKFLYSAILNNVSQ